MRKKLLRVLSMLSAESWTCTWCGQTNSGMSSSCIACGAKRT